MIDQKEKQRIYDAEHQIMPKQAFNGLPIKYFADVNEILNMWKRRYDLDNADFPFCFKDFAIDDKGYLDMPAITITPPKPAEYPLAYRIYIIADKNNPEKVGGYFLAERDKWGGKLESAMLCSWDKKDIHHNFGPVFLIKKTMARATPDPAVQMDTDKAMLAFIYEIYSGTISDKGISSLDPRTGKQWFNLEA